MDALKAPFRPGQIVLEQDVVVSMATDRQQFVVLGTTDDSTIPERGRMWGSTEYPLMGAFVELEPVDLSGYAKYGTDTVIVAKGDMVVFHRALLLSTGDRVVVIQGSPTLSWQVGKSVPLGINNSVIGGVKIDFEIAV